MGPLFSPAMLMLGRFGLGVARSSGRLGLTIGRGGVGVLKTAATVGLSSAIARAQNINETANKDYEQTARNIVRRPSIFGGVSESQRQLTSKVLDSTLAFSRYVEDQADQIEPIQPVEPTLPDLVVNRKYSPIIKDIIENINGIKERLERVEISSDNRDQILVNLKSASHVLSDEMVDIKYQEKKLRLQEDRREEEDKIERKTIGDYVMRSADKLKDMSKSMFDTLKPMMAAFGLPLALLYASQLNLPIDEETTLGDVGDTVLNTFGGAASGVQAVRGGIAGAVRRPSGVGATAGRLNRYLRGSVAGAYINIQMRLKELGVLFERLGKGRFYEAIGKRVEGLPRKLQSVARRAMNGITKWYLVIRGLTGIYTTISNGASKEVIHREIKKFLVDITNVLGIPMMIGAGIGFLFGGVGAIPGAILGFIATILAGDAISRILRVEDIVNAFYDMIVFGDTKMMRNLATSLLGADRMATQLEIEEKYGKDLSDARILEMSTIDIGTDENAVLYAFRNIRSREDYEQFKLRFERENLPNYKNILGNQKYETMEEFLAAELLPEERMQLARQIDQQIAIAGTMSAEERNVLLRNTLEYDSREQIAGYGGVTDEEYALYERGEIVPVTTVTGQRKLMTEEQFMTSDEVGIAAREAATKRIERNRRIFEVRQDRMENIIPVQNNMGSSQIVPIMMPIPTGSNGQQMINNMRAEITSPQPSMSTTDSFINLAYTT